ncbi:MAG: hypothetical protein U1D25_13060, partial [Hydrogenophaga sp.]|uniref:hypothetical protein n=1 Tax=Hydrogenophaga sp. TaxID=1904254 RepID=UPI002ABABF33
MLAPLHHFAGGHHAGDEGQVRGLHSFKKRVGAARRQGNVAPASYPSSCSPTRELKAGRVKQVVVM